MFKQGDQSTAVLCKELINSIYPKQINDVHPKKYISQALYVLHMGNFWVFPVLVMSLVLMSHQLQYSVNLDMVI